MKPSRGTRHDAELQYNMRLWALTKPAHQIACTVTEESARKVRRVLLDLQKTRKAPPRKHTESAETRQPVVADRQKPYTTGYMDQV